MVERFLIQTCLIDLRGIDLDLRYGGDSHPEENLGEYRRVLESNSVRGIASACNGRGRPTGTIIAVSIRQKES